MPRDKEQEDAYRSADLSVFGSGLFSDCVIKCGPKSWSLHRATLCSRSVWFEKTFTGLFTVRYLLLLSSNISVKLTLY
jgi:hypothetical protein